MPTASNSAAEAETQTIYQKLLEVQRELKVGKDRKSTSVRFKYRSKEDILEAAKPLCHDRGLLIHCTDETINDDGWHYVLTTATVFDALTGMSVSASGIAREADSKKGLDASQVTGMACSYAGKRALGNLFSLDDTEDADAMGSQPEPEKQPPAQGPFVAHCQNCGTRYQFQDAVQYGQFVASAGCCPSPHWVVD